jgi:hypothetical protein
LYTSFHIPTRSRPFTDLHRNRLNIDAFTDEGVGFDWNEKLAIRVERPFEGFGSRFGDLGDDEEGVSDRGRVEGVIVSCVMDRIAWV